VIDPWSGASWTRQNERPLIVVQRRMEVVYVQLKIFQQGLFRGPTLGLFLLPALTTEAKVVDGFLHILSKS